MSKDDLRSFFSQSRETNSSLSKDSQPLKSSSQLFVFGETTTSSKKKSAPKTTIPSRKKTQDSKKRSRHVFASEKLYAPLRVDVDDDDDDDDLCVVSKKTKSSKSVQEKDSVCDEIQDFDSDSSVLIVGSLASDQKKSQTSVSTSTDKQASSFTESAKDKRNEKDQLLSNGGTRLISTSVPRRIGTTAAEQRVRTERSSKWVPVNEMCRVMGIDGNFTAVDVGRVNMGIVQVSCGERKMKILDWKLLDLNELCKKFETENPQELFATGVGAYSNEAHCHCLAKWIAAQSKNNGIFDSSLVVIEAQSFSREMKAIQQTINTALILCKPSIMVRVNDPELGGEYLREANFVSPAQVVSANSVKSCYSAFFPRVTQTQTAYYAENPSMKRRAHGMSDFQNDNDVMSKQYKENKKNAVKYGSMLITVDKIIESIGAKMTDAAKKTFKSKKKDDIYDALWIFLYAIECWLPAVYSRRIRGMGAKNTMYGAMPLPRYRTFDAMFEFAESVNTPAECIEALREAMAKSSDEDAVDEGNEL